jgi:TetR/AcrR family transcriptional repressor of nem operon
MKTAIAQQNKKALLLERGMMLLWSKGYNATSVNDIVQEAGVPKGSFYFYFDSKEDFAVKAIEHYFDETFVEFEEILNDTSLSPKERLKRSFEQKITYLKQSLECSMGCLGCNLGNEMAEHSEAIRLTILKKENRLKEMLEGLVIEAQEKGEISKAVSAKDLIMFITDAGKGSMITMKEMNDVYPVDNMWRLVQQLLLA